jgi:hypothetical protein
VVANRFGAIADLGFLLHSLKNQGICVDEWKYLDEFMKLNNGGERESGLSRYQGGRIYLFIVGGGSVVVGEKDGLFHA